MYVIHATPLWQPLLPFRQVFEHLENELAFGEDDDPRGEEYEPAVGPEADVLLIPHLKRTLVGRDYLGVGLVYRHALLNAIRQDRLLVAEDYGAYAGKSWLYVVDLRLYLVRVWREGLVHERTRADDGHVAKEDVEYLRKLVYLSLPEEASERQDSRIALGRVQAASHVGAVQEHGREFQDLEVPVSVAYSVLSIEDVMLARALENYHHRHQQWRQDYDCNSREDDVEEALEELVHSFNRVEHAETCRVREMT